MLTIPLVVFAVALHSVSGAKYGLYDGEDTYVENYPYHAVMFGKYLTSWQCEGVIIGESWILTQAYCLRRGVQASGFTVRVAVGSKNATSQLYKAKAIYTHPKYQEKDIIQNYDYGLIQLDGTLKWSSAVQKVNLPKKRLSTGTTVSVATYKAAGSNAGLEDGKMSIISNSKCTSLWKTYSQTLTLQLGCLYNKGKTAYCNNSWGSPVVVDNTIYYTMVRSDPKGCTADSIPTLMADIVPAVSWITTITGIKP